MNILLYIFLSIIALIAIIWIASVIQIRVWTHHIEKFLLGKHNKLKTKENDKSKEN